MTIGFVYHTDYLKHDTGPAHPERGARLSNLVAYLKLSDLWERFVLLEPELADLKWIETVHPKEHVEHIRHTCESGAGFLDMDTTVCPASFAVARLAVGGVLKACDAVMAGTVTRAFCAIRPPGHHAESRRAMGFCLFNNVAIGARYLQQHHHLSRICIVDWDVHHGNGTQEIFYQDGSVLYFSTHQYPYYPGTGAAGETGDGPGTDANVNCPMPAGAGNPEYIAAFHQALVPAVRQFRPDFILISAGFDAHRDDPLAGMQVTEKGYAEMTRIVCDLADEFCQGRVVSVLEGGYDIHALCHSVCIHLGVLAGESA